MRITILGAGPAGLYLGILLRRVAPEIEVAILERNAPDATFGWGVVFSEETLGALRDADHVTHRQITDSFARWDAIDIAYRGETMRSRGHGFSAISRLGLLAILQARAGALGCELRFGEEVSDPLVLAAQSDLLVGADGVNSIVRRTFAGAFGPRVRPQGCRYAWFGTDRVLDAFTFVFKATEHGLFNVHAYPFDERTSTWIVECPEATWRRAGLDGMSEQESLAFCQELFEPELRGHRLMSNRSLWLSFQRVVNRTWHHGNVVLLGDAAHTAHFSIGSGTKLAMESAIALAKALTSGRELQAALTDYELERQPVVERFQAAAAESAGYFGRVERTAHLHPLQFAFNLLTRSGRIGHGNLAQRDPAFVRVLDSWMAGGSGRGVAPAPAFAPLRLRDLELPNRLVAATVTAADPTQPSHTSGHPGDGRLGGAGLWLSELVAVSGQGRVTPETPVIDDWARPDGDVACALLLGHAGPRGATRPRVHGADLPLAEGWELLSASSLPYAPFGAVPRAMDAQDMERVAGEFASAAGAAASQQADLLILDFAHGGLLASFLSPLTNRRADAYGTTPEGRLRFPLEVLAAVRERWGDRPLGVRLSVADWARGGTGASAGVAMARVLVEAGCDLVHVVAGQTVAEGRPDYRAGYLTTLSARVRTEARVPTLVGGHLTTLDQVNTIVAAGRADLCILELPESSLERLAAPETSAAVPA